MFSILQVPSPNTTEGGIGTMSGDGQTSCGDSIFVSLIDASGSMRPFWRSVAKLYNEYCPKANTHTITFSGKPRKCRSNILDENLATHGGGLTNIPSAFKELDSIVSQSPEGCAITVLFISDGQDNHLRTLQARLKTLKGHQNRKMTFLCLGIQSAFPTYLSMTLRDFYHNTQSSTPALFLIEYFTESALRNKFEAMKEFFVLRKKVLVQPPHLEFPWSFEESEKLYEGTWIVIDSEEYDGDHITMNGNEYKLADYPPTIDRVTEVFRSFTQEMQMLSLSNSELLQEQAGEALRVMTRLLDHFKESQGLDLLKTFKKIGELDSSDIKEEVDGLLKLNFSERIERNKLRHNQFRIKGYFDDIQLLAKGLGVQQLNEWEAAKRIGIGTITGNYHQRALNLRGLTISQFSILRNEFVEVFEGLQLSTQRSDQEESIITLENQKDIFMDETFIAGLKACDTQFDLVETFPIIGLSLHVSRVSGMDVDPWMIHVKDIAKHNRQIDSFSLLKSNFRLELSTGTGGTELVNAVLPLFTESDYDMQNILSHGLFNLLMTFVVHRNVDTFDEFAYFALLGNTLLYYLPHPESEYRTRQITAIQDTIQLVYGSNAGAEKYKDLLRNHPARILKDCAHVNISKPLTFALWMFHRGYFADHPEKAPVVARILIIYYFRQREDDWTSVIQVEDKQLRATIDKAESFARTQFEHFATLGDLARHFSRAADKAVARGIQNGGEMALSLNEAKLEVKGEKISFSLLCSFFVLLTGGKPDQSTLLQCAFLSGENNESVICAALAAPVAQTVKKMNTFLSSDHLRSVAKANALVRLKESFVDYFQQQHAHILPMGPQEILEHCSRLHIEPNTLVYDSKRCIVRNACMSQDCPFFLKVQSRLTKHLSTWQEKCPIGFHRLVRENTDSSPADVLSMLEGGNQLSLPSQPLDQLEPSSKPLALEYIAKVQAAYKCIDANPQSASVASFITPDRSRK